MFDSAIRRRIDRPLDRAGAWIARRGIGADQVTLAGFAVGLLAAVSIAAGHPGIGLLLVLLNRLADGLDGAVARATRKTDRGGFLDIALDFIFYAAIPTAFAVLDPPRNALPAACLMAGFLANGGAFFAFALMAERRGIGTTAQGEKSLYYVAGLAEGGETILAFILFCLLPDGFPPLAYGFAAICGVSAGGRLLLGWRLLA